MRSYRSLVFPLAAMALLTACEEQAADVAGVDTEVVSPDLAFIAPTAIPPRPVVRTVYEMKDAPGVAPALTEDQGYGTYYGYDVPTEPPVPSGIFDAKTEAWFVPGRLTVVGSNGFVGNKGRVETRANLELAGTIIGTDNGFSEKAYPFLWPPWDVHPIWAEARVYTNRECGHSGWGDSLHKAWWEAVFGGPVFNFSENYLTTRAERIYQPSCPPSPPSNGSGFGGQGGSGSGEPEGYCYVWITYDLDTGEVYNAEVIYCEGG